MSGLEKLIFLRFLHQLVLGDGGGVEIRHQLQFIQAMSANRCQNQHNSYDAAISH
jgi:hypothetical protein